MFDSLALLVSDVYQGLARPPREFLEFVDIERACVSALGFYGIGAQQSAQTRVSRCLDWNPTTRDIPLQGQVTDVMALSYLERLEGPVSDETWAFIPTCNLGSVEDSRIHGDSRCAFYATEQGLNLRLTYDPAGARHRLWYYPDATFAKVLSDPLGLPARFGPMFASKAIVKLVPLMAAKAADMPEDKRPDKTLLAAWGAITAQAQSEVTEWEKLWNYERRASRQVKARNRRPILSR